MKSKADVTLKSPNQKASKTHLRFEKVNEVTHKLVDGTKIKGWLGRHEIRALAWLMDVGWTGNLSLWVARYKDLESRPGTLAEAKVAALAMVQGTFKKTHQWKAQLNKVAAVCADYVPPVRDKERAALIAKAIAIEFEPLNAIPANTRYQLADSAGWDHAKREWVTGNVQAHNADAAPPPREPIKTLTTENWIFEFDEAHLCVRRRPA